MRIERGEVPRERGMQGGRQRTKTQESYEHEFANY